MFILCEQNTLIMRYIYLLLAGMLACANVGAQEMKRLEPDLSDFLPLLKRAGYEAYPFDISSLNGESYDIMFTTKEYEKGEYKRDVSPTILFPCERIQSYGKLTIGLSPAVDSVRTVTLSVENAGMSMRRLVLRPLEGMEGQERSEKYFYETRPFEVGPLQPDVFTPLLLIGSYWYDSGAYRFCGEREFPADMSSRTLEHLPHYYVIGITLKKQEE